jgi:hypothetical protein
MPAPRIVEPLDVVEDIGPGGIEESPLIEANQSRLLFAVTLVGDPEPKSVDGFGTLMGWCPATSVQEQSARR